MRWVAKAAVQRGLGVLPQGERLNYVFQRHVLRSLPASESVFRRPSSADLESWLDGYSLGELWEKNVLGGRPRP